MSIKTSQPVAPAGHYRVTAKDGQSYLIEWLKTSLFAPEYLAILHKAWPLARQAYLPVEMAFLRKFPEVVETEEYFSAFKPLFARGLSAVDWPAAETLMGELLKGHFIYDASSLPAQVVELFAHDTCYVATIREDASRALVGYCTFLARHTYPTGVIKVMSFAVDPRYQNRGLGKALMFSIFEMVPDTTCIFLATRVTNEAAIAAYRAWGFAPDENPILDHAFNLNHWVFLKYQVEGDQPDSAGHGI